MNPHHGASPIAPPLFPDPHAAGHHTHSDSDEGGRPENHDGGEPEASLDDEGDGGE